MGGAPKITVQTSLSARPLTFLIDSGSTFTLLAHDILEKNCTLKDDKIKLIGITGADQPVSTLGTIIGDFKFGDVKIKHRFVWW